MRHEPTPALAALPLIHGEQFDRERPPVIHYMAGGEFDEPLRRSRRRRMTKFAITAPLSRPRSVEKATPSTPFLPHFKTYPKTN